jgi:hypothetical protein
MNEPFRMNVQEVFHFQDGTTVFAGEVTEGPENIVGGVYELTVEGEQIGSVKIDGERSRGRVPNIRSVDTHQKLGFDSDSLKGREVVFGILQRVR